MCLSEYPGVIVMDGRVTFQSHNKGQHYTWVGGDLVDNIYHRENKLLLPSGIYVSVQ